MYMYAHKETFVGASYRIADVRGALLNGFRQQVHLALLEFVERVERTVQQRIGRGLHPATSSELKEII